ncbi:MAG: YihY/virulence factor BrkB family protein [Polyangiaceae bacterium]|nr:YihY/virulence factor BrkB family protein [Polyangiaceae bacterium]
MSRTIFHRGVALVRNIVLAMDKHDAVTAASAMAYSFFLSLIPLLLALGYIIGHMVRVRGTDVVLGPLVDAAPPAAQSIISRELDTLAGTGVGFAPLVALGFLWVSSSGVHGLINGLEIVLRAQRRPWWQKRALSVACILGALASLVAVGWGISYVIHLAPGRVRTLLVPFILLVVGTCGLSGFYRVAVVHTEVIQRRAWPGAFVAVTAWLLVSWAFSAYVRTLGNYSVYYGSLAAVAVLLFWCWLTALALLLGAEVNAQLEGVRLQPKRPSHP